MHIHLPLRTAGLFLLIVALRGTVCGEVLDSLASGFTVKNVVDIAAPPEEVYGRLVNEVGGMVESRAFVVRAF